MRLPIVTRALVANVALAVWMGLITGICQTATAQSKTAQPKTTQSKAAKQVVTTAAAVPAKLAAPVVDNNPVAWDPLDWPMWRGPEQNGISREKGLVDRWDPAGENLLWSKPELATRSTPIVMRGKLYTLCRSEPGTPSEGEKVVCADAATGKILWENKFNVFLSDVPAERVAWSCCVGDPTTGRVYAMGVCGYLQCLDGETGKTVWSHSLSEEFGLLSTYGGRTNVPVIFEDLCIISAVTTGWGELARPAHRFMAFDKTNGTLVWMNGTRPLPDDTTYSTPALAVLDGQAAMVFGSGDGAVWAFQPRTGKPIWTYRLSLRGMNTSPIVVGDTVYMGQSEENRDDSSMGALAAIKGAGADDITTSGELWREKNIMIGKSSPLLVNGRLYALDDSNVLYVVDAATGKLLSKKTRLMGTIARASLLYADGKIYACTTSAWHVLEPTGDHLKIVHRLRLKLGEGEEVHGSPIVSHGRIYLPTTLAMYCIGKSDAKTTETKPQVDPRPAPAKEAALTDMQPAQIQLVPAEVLIKPGETVQFQTRLYNAKGQLLKVAPATYSVDGGGQIDKQGQFTADQAATDSTATHRGVLVTATAGKLAGTARIRIEPPLPWKFDFSDNQVPITWVGARYRHVVRDLDGDKVMVKVTTIPKGTRSQSWMGPTDLHDYTVQADVRGGQRSVAPPPAAPAAGATASAATATQTPPPPKKTDDDEAPKVGGGRMPDIGLIAQRYTLDLMGDHQELQIRSWTAKLDRFSKSVPFAWKTDTWYTMKFSAANEDGKAVLRGKVWPRGEPEPKQWTIEAVDVEGNHAGSPGLFGNASDAEIFLDNVSVTAN